MYIHVVYPPPWVSFVSFVSNTTLNREPTPTPREKKGPRVVHTSYEVPRTRYEVPMYIQVRGTYVHTRYVLVHRYIYSVHVHMYIGTCTRYRCTCTYPKYQLCGLGEIKVGGLGGDGEGQLHYYLFLIVTHTIRYFTGKM